MTTFSSDNYAFIILDGYVMALIKHTDNCIYVFDSHARNEYGMPDDNGTAVVMKCFDITNLYRYIFSIANELNSQFFEIMPVQFYSNGIIAQSANLFSYNVNPRKRKVDKYTTKKNCREKQECI